MRRASLLALIALAAAAGTARAHGDRASEVLQEHQVFFPVSGGTVASASSTALERAVQQANRSGYDLRVAVIATPEDLAARTGFWERPGSYAAFLGDELAQVFPTGRILVAMPSGFALLRGTARDRRVSREAPSASGADELVRATTAAVERLANLPGPRTSVTGETEGSSSWGGTRLAIAIGGAAILALLGLLAYRYFPGRSQGR